MSYTPHTPTDIAAMLNTIGASSIDELFEEIPAELRDFELQVPHQQSEQMSSMKAQAFAEKDPKISSFIGAGAYEHYIPAAVWDVVSRGEFMTAYTPYQAEIAQGRLEMLLNFQTIVIDLTGMEIANASLLDEATAAASEIKAAADAAVAEATTKKQAADAALTAAAAKLKAVTDHAAPRDTADIVLSEPIAIRVK